MEQYRIRQIQLSEARSGNIDSTVSKNLVRKRKVSPIEQLLEILFFLLRVMLYLVYEVGFNKRPMITSR